LVALKVVKSASHYTAAAEDEIKLLNEVWEKTRKYDQGPPIVLLLDHFYIRGPNGKHVCMIFEVLGANLLKAIKYFKYEGLPVSLVKKIAKQLLEGLRVLHDDCKIIHTDLKPENVLLALSKSDRQGLLESFSDHSFAELSGSIDGIENMNLSQSGLSDVSMPRRSEMTISKSRAYSLDFLDDTQGEGLQVKIADLGNACWVDRHFTNDIQTRQYRAPEIILGLSYGTTVDIWSCACMIFELLTGDFLFEPRTGKAYDKNEDHIAQMIELLGKMPRRMITHGRYSGAIFNRKQDLRHIRDLEFWPLPSVLEEKYRFSRHDSQMMASFLLPMLDYNGDSRATAAECLRHPWLNDA
jgi:serine/threonine-protein kinase SRPK3